MYQRKNFAYGTVLTPPDPATSGTTVILNSGHGARFPNTTGGQYVCVVKEVSVPCTPENSEVVLVTSHDPAGDTFTITRTQESSSARTIVAGDEFYLAPTDGVWDQLDVLTTKGDLLSQSAAGVYARLAVGTNGYALVADSGETAGLKWIDLASRTETLSNKTLGTSNLLSFNSPRGFLINGKIVPSVSSNNLTVAIKGIDGNDPSATNPVYCRIGDTIRSITAALSVTKNAGTNWCNSGASELAAKEVDYFVYLGYNATDGVVIGFSRISHGTEYNSFSATSTNNTYCAISTITNASAGDDYELIGRFAATLSAGAGYTWTVPTFTNKNLIQYPVYESRWLYWLPTYSADGSMTYTSTSTGRYKIERSMFRYHILTDGTTGGTASSAILLTLPVTILNTGPYIGMGYGTVYDAADNIGLIFRSGTNNTIIASKSGGANYNLGSTKQIRIMGFFEI